MLRVNTIKAGFRYANTHLRIRGYNLQFPSREENLENSNLKQSEHRTHGTKMKRFVSFGWNSIFAFQPALPSSIML